jgi:uncharacterized protein (DUF697 family)
MPKLPDLWRVLSELDLGAIHREAQRPFDLLIAGDSLAEAHAVALGLNGPRAGGLHPWIRVAEAKEEGPTPSPGMANAALIVTRSPKLSPALARAQGALTAAKVPAVTVVTAAEQPTDALVRAGEAGRVQVTSMDRSGVAVISTALLAAVPAGVRLALARHLPGLRDAYLKSLIEETARANAAYAFTSGVAESVPGLGAPLNLADIVVLTKNQLVMSYRIALAAGKSGAPRDLLGEVIGVIGGGLLFRQGARQLIGLIPVAGIAPKVAVAYAGTWAIGKAVSAWANEGQRLSASAIRGFYREAWERGKQVAAGLANRAGVRRWPRWRRRKELPADESTKDRPADR